jgi:hypothetical protein
MSSSAMAQNDTTEVREAVVAMENALMGNDGSALEKLLHPELTFGHSNGWIQTKQQVIGDMNSGYLRYVSFQQESLSIMRSKKRAVVKEFVQVTGQRAGAPFNVRLFVLQEWVLTKQGWKLMIRQGAKQS